MSAPDWRDMALDEGGRGLIEASAGTGKTWTIAALYLRLLLERRLTPRQIAVATFSEAAAQELRERIRGRVQAAAALAADPASHAPGDDECEDWLIARLQPDDALQLRLALAELDIAPIGTLHALCQRVLHEQPFHTGAGFAAATLVDGRQLRAELADDLWRRWTQASTPPDSASAWLRSGREALARALALALRPGVRLPALGEDGVAALLREGDPAALRARAEDAAWFKSSASVLRRGMHALAQWLECADAEATLDKHRLADLGADLDKQIKPGRLPEAIDDPLFRFVQRAHAVLVQAAEHRRLAALVREVPALQAAAQARMAACGQRSFDSLIGDVDAALRHNPALAEALHRQWPAVLVDEFQDTDAVQYAILDAIHSDPDGRPRGRWVMVGDPKQAIYGFRGGDVHGYLRAARAVPAQARLALTVNRRSTPAYVQACNALFAQAGERLTTDEHQPDAIAYREVTASTRHRDAAYRIGGVAVERPLVIHYRPEPEGAPPSAAERRREALASCAGQVAGLLDGRHALGDVPLAPGDIAVLVPNNEDIAALRRQLLARGVPCVGGGRSSVFASPWAQALQLQLQAAVTPGDPAAVRAGLASSLGGASFADLLRLRDVEGETDPRWQAVLQRAQDWHGLWARRGVLAVVQAIIEHALPLLTDGDEVERALTDLRHLGELLQAREADVPGPAELLAWLAQQRAHRLGALDEDAAEEQALRLESDARRVQLMTLHAAKGLEFGVVMLPLLWAQTGRRESLVAVDDGVAGPVLRNDAAALARQAQDHQDERMRLLYVALTRASHACHVLALDPERPCQPGRPRGTLIDPARSALDALLARVFRTIGRPEAGRSLRDVAAGIDWRTGWPVGTGRVAAAPLPGTPAPVVRPAPAAPARLPWRHSFSSLVRRHDAQALEASAAADEALIVSQAEADAAPAVAPPHPELLALQAWKGTAFGNAVHEVLEQHVPGVILVDRQPAVAAALRRRGLLLPPQAVATLAARLDAVLATPLLDGIALGALPPAGWRTEMAFDYRLDQVAVARLQELLAAHGWTLPPLASAQLHGAMTGKIDLVFEHAGRFHVLDWKGNWLGDAVEDYTGAGLTAAMEAHHYRLQALLYTVALDRHLRMRLGAGYVRTRQLGDSLYLFVRAVGLAPGAGVWRERFDDALIAAVDALLAGGEAP